MRTTIRLDDRLLEKTKKYALSHGTTFTSVVEDALREKLMGRPSGKRQPAVKLKTVNGKGTHAGVDLDDSSSLQDLMDS